MNVKKDSLAKVGLTSTKKEILDAFHAAKQELEQKAESELKPEKKVEEKKEKETVKFADTVSSDSITKHINDLKMDIGKMLSQITDKLEEETNKYRRIQEAIDVKNKELQEVYEIEKSANALAALIEVQKRKKEEFDEQMNYVKKQFEDETAGERADWEREKKEYNETAGKRDAEEKKMRERQKEEFNYAFQREQMLVKNKFNDETAKLEKELAAKREEVEKYKLEKEKSLQEREINASEKEKQLDALQKKVETASKDVETAVNRAIGDTTKKLKEEAAKNEEILKKEFDGERNVFKTKIESFSKVVGDQSKQIDNLSQQLEKAYGKVQDIAVKAVEGSANVKALNNLSQIIEKNKRQGQE
ncbi:MAG: hypothetical protein KJ893_10985 [Candidatus Omnitrophica bacterium]|nr:hypothetical protein [Candidatus Omnitrophota bacterium]MBU4479743.1 hypothetical protein [Candidatus Omnitrophota bacterium]